MIHARCLNCGQQLGVAAHACPPRTTEKKCGRCELTKPVSEFGTKKSHNGRRYPAYLCKPCAVITAGEWAATHPSNRSLVVARSNRLHPQKRVARIEVGNALRDGRLKRRACEGCGAAKTQAHHHDYSKPLDVIWFCTQCHAKEHQRAV